MSPRDKSSPNARPPDPDHGGSWLRLGTVAARIVRKAFARNRVKRWAGASPKDARRAQLVRHLHALGPRPVLEFVDELARLHGIGAEVNALLETYGELDLQIVAALGAREIPQPPLHEVES